MLLTLLLGIVLSAKVKESEKVKIKVTSRGLVVK